MFGAASKLTSAASKVAGAAANTVSGTASFAEHEAAKVGGAAANTVSGTASFVGHEAAKVGGTAAGAVSGAAKVAGHEAYEVGAAAANTVSGTISFSEHQAMKHVRALAGLGSRSAAQEYVLKEYQDIKEKAPSDVDVDVDVIPAKSGSSDQESVLLKLSPKNVPEANKNAILVSSGLNAIRDEDDASSVAVMLELARSVSQEASGFKNSVIFFMNTGEEEGLNGSHSFITQNPWNATIRLAVDLEGMGIGGQPITSQAGGLKNPVVVLFDGEEGVAGAFNEHLPKQAVLDFQAMHYKGTSFKVQDIFARGAIQSATDFQVYEEVGALSGLDFAYEDGGAVYHTKNDKFELLKPVSIQHLGENMLPFLLQVASSPVLQ